MPGWANIANLFTLLRLGLVPFVVLAILQGSHLVALVLFIAAGLTDVIDGALARGFGLATPSGAYLDPIADKCLLCGIFLALGSSGIIPWWFVAVVFGRDLYILVGVLGFLALTNVRKFPPSIWGKASTFVQISTAVVWMVRNIWMARNIPNVPVLHALSSAMLWVCAGFTIWSGLDYTRRGVQLIRAH
ncbi:MAG TPA: CDP-alcohol phosphatidyltransferase family protein [Candidatus Acidoferrales bacterium]|jgi:cardiolipin synthase|nr:CDP-alcohol phosphatidyltransferase family protein [Candidatus Acidoferrales bacterium]